MFDVNITTVPRYFLRFVTTTTTTQLLRHYGGFPSSIFLFLSLRERVEQCRPSLCRLSLYRQLLLELLPVVLQAVVVTHPCRCRLRSDRRSPRYLGSGSVVHESFHLLSLCSSVLCLGQCDRYRFPPASLISTDASSTFRSSAWDDSWIFNTTLELSHQIGLNSKVSSWSSHCSSSDCSMRGEHHMTSALVEPTNPDSFHPLHIKFLPETRKGQSALLIMHASIKVKQRTFAARARSDFPSEVPPL